MRKGAAMTENKLDLIFHPIRIRLMTELSGRRMTTAQLREAMPDVAQATLYRHVKRLLGGGMIEVVDEQVVNGATERTYALIPGQDSLTDADLQGLTADEHVHNFSLFSTLLIDAFQRYVEQADLNALIADGLSYNRAVIYLDDAERVAFQQQVVALLRSVMSNPPSPARRRYTLASIVIPDERNKSDESGND
ncbi:helix-turn-helix domain-containing protein [bacterium]|nr:helix-turn-helix domain-containing protein [bacterium]